MVASVMGASRSPVLGREKQSRSRAANFVLENENSPFSAREWNSFLHPQKKGKRIAVTPKVYSLTFFFVCSEIHQKLRLWPKVFKRLFSRPGIPNSSILSNFSQALKKLIAFAKAPSMQRSYCSTTMNILKKLAQLIKRSPEASVRDLAHAPVRSTATR
jgi:hypothetical protein